MTKDCYQIITDEPALKSFIEWLPEHSVEECYFYALFCRPKYSANMKGSGGNLLFRGIADKKSLFRKFRQLECPIGAYEKKGVSVPQESLALYINPNARSLYSATLNTLVQLSQNIKAGHKTASPHKEALSCIQTSSGEKTFIDFDIDSKDPEILKKALTILGKSSNEIIETRGGYHVLVRRDSIHQIEDKMWYKKLQELSDVSGDCLVPVVGGIQGTFTPKFVDPASFL
jgi:hypothetical protein